MKQYPKWKIILVLCVCAWGVIYTLPNFFPAETVANFAQAHKLPSWMPLYRTNLGLDLQGGSHLLLQVDVKAAVNESLSSLLDGESGIRKQLEKEGVDATDITVEDGSIKLHVADFESREKAARIISDSDNGIVTETNSDGRLTATYNDPAMNQLRTRWMEQSISIVERRVNETGTREPLIQQQGADRIVVQVPGLDNPERLKALLGTTAKLTFQVVDDSVTVAEASSGRRPPGTEILKASEKEGGRMVVKKRIEVGGEKLKDARPTFDEYNRPSVSFQFDSAGARRFGETTAKNIGKRLAIVLDKTVISAPRIQSEIRERGVITGQFTVEEASDLALLLRSGALPAPLHILEERTVGPSLGSDSIRQGKISGTVSFLLVSGFMVLTYGLFGLFACAALVANMAIIFAAMSMLESTLTLPGIAGIVLTIGMAVDANVLIFERIREETASGRSAIAAIENGFGRAMSTIIDSNLTTLIAAAFMYSFGAGPVRGFAVTLTIGILASMFTSITFTRLLVVTWFRKTRPAQLGI
ncbi:MAG TPA: protein translocase subunit SecD [Rhodospirillaceae bacterium]|nr:MAG: protein-export membrane protein SecD [Alphaproteobacteria bacterium GWF2_58_20]HAU28833.1 protein translocase subunit SecD [Rhodospirillaceae bacterium]